jgi:hypothetical protein
MGGLRRSKKQGDHYNLALGLVWGGAVFYVYWLNKNHCLVFLLPMKSQFTGLCAGFRMGVGRANWLIAIFTKIFTEL